MNMRSSNFSNPYLVQNAITTMQDKFRSKSSSSNSAKMYYYNCNTTASRGIKYISIQYRSTRIHVAKSVCSLVQAKQSINGDSWLDLSLPSLPISYLWLWVVENGKGEKVCMLSPEPANCEIVLEGMVGFSETSYSVQTRKTSTHGKFVQCIAATVPSCLSGCKRAATFLAVGGIWCPFSPDYSVARHFLLYCIAIFCLVSYRYASFPWRAVSCQHLQSAH